MIFVSIFAGKEGFWPEITLLLTLLSFSLKDGFNGHSPGKALLGLQAVKTTNLEPIGFSLSFRRNLSILATDPLRWIPILLPSISPDTSFILFLAFANPIILIAFAYRLRKGPRWGDCFAETMVIWKKYRHCVPFDTRGILCQNCSYNLTENVSGVCPECGTPIR